MPEFDQVAARLQIAPEQMCHTRRTSRNAAPGATSGKLKSQTSWARPATFPGSVHVSRLLVTFWPTDRTRNGTNISRIGYPASGGEKVGRRTVETTTFCTASMPRDCRQCAEPMTSPKAESGTKAEGRICEFATGCVPFLPLPGPDDIAKSRCWSRLPVTTNKARG